MKKQLLLGACLLGSFFVASAQSTTSFESSEGYTIGPLDGQNDWGVSQLDAGGTLMQNIEVTDAMASDGTFSLSITMDPATGQTNGATRGAFGPLFEADFSNIVASFDFFIEVDEDEETEGADYDVAFQSVGEQKLTSRVKFSFDGTVAVVDITGAGTPGFVDTEADWTAGEWHTMSIVHNFDDNTIVYILDGATIFEGTNWNAVTTVDNIAVLHDNFEGSTLFIDNFAVVDGSVAGVNDNLVSQISVYPNPANNVINVANAENILVNGITITDLNGRTVKSVQYNGVTEAQVNISDLSSGMYIMTVSSDKGSMTKKIVKQ